MQRVQRQSYSYVRQAHRKVLHQVRPLRATLQKVRESVEIIGSVPYLSVRR